MSKKALQGIKKIMASMDFHPTEILLKTLYDMYMSHGIIDEEILQEIVRREKKAMFKLTEVGK